MYIQIHVFIFKNIYLYFIKENATLSIYNIIFHKKIVTGRDGKEI